jgi:multidrug resistance efflux pump
MHDLYLLASAQKTVGYVVAVILLLAFVVAIAVILIFVIIIEITHHPSARNASNQD